MVCVPHTAVRTMNLWFVGRTRPFVRRTSGLRTAHGRSFDEPVVCAPRMSVRTTNRWFVHRTRRSFEEQVGCAPHTVCVVWWPHTAVRSTNKWFVHRTPPFVRRTCGLGTVRGRSFDEQVVCALFVRRTCGLGTARGRSFDEQVVCAPHTGARTSGLCTAHGRSFHEQVVYAPHTVVPSSNKWFRHRTRPFVQRTSGFSFRRTNGRVRWLNHLFVERTAVFGHQFVVRTAVCGA